MSTHSTRRLRPVAVGLLAGVIALSHPIDSSAVLAACFEEKLTATGGALRDRFGKSVSLDGNRAIVGAFDVDGAGAAYVFLRTSNGWVQEAVLTAPERTINDAFGYSVGIAGDRAVVGAFEAPIVLGAPGRPGSAYAYRQVGSAWVLEAHLRASDPTEFGLFGYSVSISGDGILVGAPHHKDAGNGSGAAYLFRRSNSEWTEEAKLTPLDLAAHDEFGHAVSFDGIRAAVSSLLDDDHGAASGSIYLFQQLSGVWTEEAKLTASDGASIDHFGESISIEGNTLIAGAPFDDDKGDLSGSAYIFRNAAGSWTEESKLTASDGDAFDHFGFSVAVDGDFTVVGAPLVGPQEGAAYLYQRDSATWSEAARIAGLNTGDHHRFGDAVSIDGDHLIIGAPGAGGSANPNPISGSAHVFVLTDANAVCGDVDSSNCIDAIDSSKLRVAFADPNGRPLSAEGELRCNVINGSASWCDILDLAVLRRVLAEPPLPPGIAPVCF